MRKYYIAERENKSLTEFVVIAQQKDLKDGDIIHVIELPRQHEIDEVFWNGLDSLWQQKHHTKVFNLFSEKYNLRLNVLNTFILNYIFERWFEL